MFLLNVVVIIVIYIVVFIKIYKIMKGVCEEKNESIVLGILFVLIILNFENLIYELLCN